MMNSSHVRAAVVDFMSDYDTLGSFDLCDETCEDRDGQNCREYRDKLGDVYRAWKERSDVRYTPEEVSEAIRRIEIETGLLIGDSESGSSAPVECRF